MGGGSGKALQRRAIMWTPVEGTEPRWLVERVSRQRELRVGRPEHVRSSLSKIWKSVGPIVEPGSVPQ